MATWGIHLVSVPQEGSIIDIGCGGGGNVGRLLQWSEKAKVIGVDYSSVSVTKSRKVNAKAIAAGRCEITEANVAALPFDEGSFNMATAFETIYFWPDIEKSFAEVRRVLAQDGIFLIVNEDDGLSGINDKWEKIIEGMHTYSPVEIKKHLEAAGFRDIKVQCGSEKHWVAVSAVK